MAFDAYIGESGTTWRLLARVGGSPVDLTGAVIELVASKPAGGIAPFQSPEHFAVVSAREGTFTFSPSVGVVDDGGTWTLQPFVNGHACDPIEWRVGP